jgi:hypothetical protein
MSKEKENNKVNSVSAAEIFGGIIALRQAWKTASFAVRKINDAKFVTLANKKLYDEKTSPINEFKNLDITGKDITDNYDFENYSFADDGFRPNIKYLKNVAKMLNATKDGKELLKIAEEEHTSFSSISSNMIAGSLYPAENHIEVNRSVGIKRAVISLAHELNHNKQFNRDFTDFLEVNPYEALLVHKVLEADSVSKEVCVAWELKEKGMPEFFDSEKNGSYAKSYRKFEKEVNKDPKSLENGEARRAAFEGWFAEKEIGKIYEKQFLDILERETPELLNTRGFKEINNKKDNDCVKELFERMGKMPNGVNYLTETRNCCPSISISKRLPIYSKLDEALKEKSKAIGFEPIRRYSIQDEIAKAISAGKIR